MGGAGLRKTGFQWEPDAAGFKPVACLSSIWIRRDIMMGMGFFMLGPSLIALLAGIAILIWPRLLNYIVAFYLILFGLLGLLGNLMMGAGPGW